MSRDLSSGCSAVTTRKAYSDQPLLSGERGIRVDTVTPPLQSEAKLPQTTPDPQCKVEPSILAQPHQPSTSWLTNAWTTVKTCFIKAIELQGASLHSNNWPIYCYKTFKSENGFHTSLTVAKVYFYVFADNFINTSLKKPLSFHFSLQRQEREARTWRAVVQDGLSVSLSVVRQLPGGSGSDCQADGMEVPQGTAGFPQDRSLKGQWGSSSSSWGWRWDEGSCTFILRLPEVSLHSASSWGAKQKEQMKSILQTSPGRKPSSRSSKALSHHFQAPWTGSFPVAECSPLITWGLSVKLFADTGLSSWKGLFPSFRPQGPA